MQKLANLLRTRIVAMPGVTEYFGKTGVYYRTTKSFTRLEFLRNQILVLLRDAKYPSDRMRLVRDVTSNEWGYKGLFKFVPDSDLEYVFNLVKQSYESTL